MPITAFSGPIGQFGTVLTASAGTGLLGLDTEHNNQRGPMFSDLGDMLMDPRVAFAFQPGSAVTAKTFGFYNNQFLVDYVPLTINTSALNASSIVSTGVTTYSIPSSLGVSSNGIISTTIIAPETGTATGTLLAIDSTAAYVTFGSDGALAAWNPSAGTGRNVQIITSSSGDGGTFSIAGRDMYGFKITESIALSQGTTNSSGVTMKTQKAFKYISSIKNTTTPTSTGVSIGFGDTYGFPLYTPYVGFNSQVAILASGVGSSLGGIVNLSSGNTILAAGTSITQTSTTADVRGTFASTTASNGVVRIQMLCTPVASAAAGITSTNVAPFFGATQFSSV
jgi:hypothetical protein